MLPSNADKYVLTVGLICASEYTLALARVVASAEVRSVISDARLVAIVPSAAVALFVSVRTLAVASPDAVVIAPETAVPLFVNSDARLAVSVASAARARTASAATLVVASPDAVVMAPETAVPLFVTSLDKFVVRVASAAVALFVSTRTLAVASDAAVVMAPETAVPLFVISVPSALDALVDSELMDVVRLPSADWNAVTSSLRLFRAVASVLVNILSIRMPNADSAPVERFVSTRTLAVASDAADAIADAIAAFDLEVASPAAVLIALETAVPLFVTSLARSARNVASAARAADASVVTKPVTVVIAVPRVVNSLARSAVNVASAAVARLVSVNTFAVASDAAADCAAFAFVVASPDAVVIAPETAVPLFETSLARLAVNVDSAARAAAASVDKLEVSVETAALRVVNSVERLDVRVASAALAAAASEPRLVVNVASAAVARLYSVVIAPLSVPSAARARTASAATFDVASAAAVEIAEETALVLLVTSVPRLLAAVEDNELIDVVRLPSADWNAVTNSARLLRAVPSMLLNTLSIRTPNALSAAVRRTASALTAVDIAASACVVEYF